MRKVLPKMFIKNTPPFNALFVHHHQVTTFIDKKETFLGIIKLKLKKQKLL